MGWFVLFYNDSSNTESHTDPTSCRTAQQVQFMRSTMSLIVTLLVVTLVSQCCSAPQRRNWTPQAILYLKGAQGHRSALKRTSREDLASHNQSNDGLGLSLSSIFLELLQRAVEEGGGNLENYPDGQELNLSYF